MEEDAKSWGIKQSAIFFLGAVLLMGSVILLTIMVAARRKNKRSDDRSSTKHLKLPISASDNTYTVAYQLKAGSKQPDIISRGKSVSGRHFREVLEGSKYTLAEPYWDPWQDIF